ncbi:MAG: HAD family hydrolase [Caldilineaceae bacterium]|nr:HAD family hydrolase [Caldilineaceae bacterium]
MKVAAIFDLDDTLLSDSSAKLIVKYMRSTGELWRYFRRRDVLSAFASVTGWRLGLLDATQATARTAQMAAGIEVDAFWALVRRWFNEMLIDSISPAARERLDWHRAQGHIPVICSASSQFSVQPVAQHLGIEHAVFTEWIAHQGLLTGKIRLPIAYGLGKVHWMENWAKVHDVNLADSYFYSDDASDRPLLERVGNPFAVNPTPRLARVAAQQAWPVLHWRASSP